MYQQTVVTLAKPAVPLAILVAILILSATRQAYVKEIVTTLVILVVSGLVVVALSESVMEVLIVQEESVAPANQLGVVAKDRHVVLLVTPVITHILPAT